MATQKKVETVNELTEKVKKAKSIVFAEYKGIKHKQLEELRKNLKNANAEMMVSKNRLMLRALGDSADTVKDTLVGETAVVFSYGDEVSGVKELTKFFEAIALGKAKGGLLGTTLLTAQDVAKLAKIPSKEVLLAKLAGQLQAPIRGLHYSLSWNLNKLVWALNAVKGKK